MFHPLEDLLLVRNVFFFFELFMAGYEDINQVSVEDVENLDGVNRVLGCQVRDKGSRVLGQGRIENISIL